MKRLSLKSKIIISIIISALFLCILVVVMSFTYLDKILSNGKLKEIEKLNIEQTHESEKIFKNNQTFAKMLGTRTRVKEYLLNPTDVRRDELLNIFFEYAKEDTKYLALYLLDKNGKAVISTDPRFLGQDYGFRDYYKNGIKGYPHTDLLLGNVSNEFGYYFSHPVFNDNKDVIGVFVSKVNNKEIDNAMLNSQIATDSTVMLVDSNGIIITSNKNDRFLKSLGALREEEKKYITESKKFIDRKINPLQYDIAQEAIRSGVASKILEFKDEEEGEVEILNINKIGEFPFYLVTETGLDSVRNTILKTILILLSLIILSVFIACFVIYILIIKALSPLGKLKNLAKNIASGNFSQRLEINTDDELGDLSKTFNKMSEDLSDLYKNLDKKVEEQTKKLNSKKEELENQKSAILNILEDVQKEKNKSEELSSIVRDANEPIVGQDMNGIILSWNKGATDLYGYSAEEAIGKSIKIIIPEEKREEYENMKKTIISAPNVKVDHYQTIRKNKNGNLIDVAISVSPIKDISSKIIGISVITLDITKEKEIDKAKTEFVSLASHQLRTPLSSINWYTEMLLAGDAGAINDEQKKYLEEVAIGNKRMVELVDSLLNVSRLDLGTFIIEPKILNIVDLAKSVLGELKPQIIERKQKVEEKYDENIGDFLADEKLLRIIFQNLLSNAVKYTPSNGIIKIEIMHLLKDSNFENIKIKADSLGIRISDNGMGIPTNQKEKIFSKLFRADNARESETEGTGLGLYILKSIVDQSGGIIDFRTEENNGTTFYIVFPKTGMKKKEGLKKLD